MIVIDASAAMALVLGEAVEDNQWLAETIAAPCLIDPEVVNGLRNRILTGDLDEDNAAAALNDYAALDIERFPTPALVARMWELRHNLTGYDAAYVALAELLDAETLLTTDRKLAGAPGPRCTITMLEG